MKKSIWCVASVGSCVGIGAKMAEKDFSLKPPSAFLIQKSLKLAEWCRKNSKLSIFIKLFSTLVENYLK